MTRALDKAVKAWQPLRNEYIAAGTVALYDLDLPATFKRFRLSGYFFSSVGAVPLTGLFRRNAVFLNTATDYRFNIWRKEITATAVYSATQSNVVDLGTYGDAAIPLHVTSEIHPGIAGSYPTINAVIEAYSTGGNVYLSRHHYYVQSLGRVDMLRLAMSSGVFSAGTDFLLEGLPI